MGPILLVALKKDPIIVANFFLTKMIFKVKYYGINDDIKIR